MDINKPDPAHAKSRGEAWEDLHLERTGSKPKFDRLTEAPLLYVPVHKEKGPIGYLWASTDGKAANFLSCLSANTEERNAKSVWISRLIQAKEEGLDSIEALKRWIGSPADARGGRIPSDSPLKKTENLQELQDIANSH